MEAWQRVSGARIVAACDLDPAKAESFAADFGLRPYSDAAAMIEAERPDFVDIATRPSTHRALVELVAGRVTNLLLQKPIAETWEQACQISNIAQKAGLRLMMNENWRWQPWYRTIAGLIGANRIGKPFFYRMEVRHRDGVGDRPFPSQPYFVEMPRFLLMETLVHHLDTARYLMGDIEEVYCRTARLNPVISGEDFAMISLRHGNGALGNGVVGMIDGNRTTQPDEAGEVMGSSRFEGSEATIQLRGNGEVWLSGEQVFSGRDLIGYKGDSCRATQQHFIDCLLSGAEFETEVSDYLNTTVAAVEACYRSSAENRPVLIAEITRA
jgi:predicted dehydrogenase